MERKILMMIGIYGLIVLFLVGFWQLGAGEKKEVLAYSVSVKATKEPEATKKPETTKEPKATKQPEATKKPETTRKPKVKEKKTKKKKKKLKKIHVSASGRKILERIVEAEAGGEDLKGRILVANVILNRLKNPAYPNSVRGVVYAKSGSTYQFSPVSDGRINTVTVSDKTKKAVKLALNGKDYSKGALYFMCRRTASEKNRRWFDTRLKRVLIHGGHEFFRK